MKSPEQMRIIEIDITNACVHACSNCTRFCGHHKKNFFMSFDTFKKAIDSLKDWDGIIGIIGGEPTLHPEFERFADYLREYRVKESVREARGPIYDMQLHILANPNAKKSNVVLLSSLSNSYYKHFETINDTFSYQLLNDHANACEHQSLLMNRKELNISDEEWIAKRDACWIQNTWSATVTPKGAFFCEVAGALDMLFDGPGGWQVEEGWHKRTPEEFGEQLKWCEMCSGCLDVPKRLSNEEIDDVTPETFKKLTELESPKALNGKCVIRDPKRYEEYKEATYATGVEYIEAGDNVRTTSDNRNLYPKAVTYINRNDIVKGLKEQKPTDWVVLYEGDVSPEVEKFMKEYILNPGCLYILDDGTYIFNIMARSLREIVKYPEAFDCTVKKYYPEDKIIHFSLDDPYGFLAGGICESEYQKAEKPMGPLIVYGAGMIGKMVVERLDEREVSDYFIAVTEKCDCEKEMCGHPIYELAELKKYATEATVLIATTPYHHESMVKQLNQLGFKNYRFLA